MFLSLLFAYVLSQFYRAFLAVLAGPISAELGLNAAQLGGLQASWFATFALAQFPIGLALDRFGARRTLSVAMSAAVVGATLLAGADGFLQAAVAMALIGLGCAPVLMAGFYLIARTYAPDRFAFVSSMLLGLGSLGDPLSGMPLAFLADAFGWRATMAAMAAFTAASVLCVALLLRDPPAAVAPPGRGSVLAGVREVLRLPALRPILPLALVSYAAVITTRGLWITPFLEEVHGFGRDAASAAATGMGLAIAAGTLLYVPALRLVGSVKGTVLAGVASTALAWSALGRLDGGSPLAAVALLLAIGAAGAPFALVMTHARSFMPAHALGVGVTLMNLAFMGGAALTQWLSGLFVHASRRAGDPPELVFGSLFVAFGMAAGAAAFVYAFAPPDRR